MGAEIEPGETIPGETGVVAVAVDFRKGCYPGQELVERMDSRGRRAAVAARPRRRRRPRRAIRRARRRRVGVLTSVAGDGLGYVKRGVDVGRGAGALMAADLDLVRRLVAADHGLAVVATTRADGSVHASVVNAGVLDDPLTGVPVVGFVARRRRR